eukprot:TRINITY_DN48165_c0_g1_i1.p1 TRINITY_DN48165_c0_g1~~TRINITY_DN48165_c0_g1_i1.p1  ORF type:complete len:276 (-),score=33.23 TRINITY_DN48165_c0_g1_i1:157-864(-)
MVALAEIRSGDVVLDLGAGDGRLLIAAARAGASLCIGLELDEERARSCRQSCDEVLGEELARRVVIQQRNAMNVTPSEAVALGVSVVLLYLTPRGYRLTLPLIRGISAARRRLLDAAVGVTPAKSEISSATAESPLPQELRVVTYNGGFCEASGDGSVHGSSCDDSLVMSSLVRTVRVHTPHQPGSEWPVALHHFPGNDDDDDAYMRWFTACATGGAGDGSGEGTTVPSRFTDPV